MQFYFLIPKICDFISLAVKSANPKQTPQNSDSTLAPRTEDNMWFGWQVTYQELTKQKRGTTQSWKQALFGYISVPTESPPSEDTIVVIMP